METKKYKHLPSIKILFWWDKGYTDYLKRKLGK